MKRLVCVYNSRAAAALRPEKIRRLFAPHGASVQCVGIRQGIDAIDAKTCDVLVAVGGDGTVRAVAERAISLGKPLAVLPAGTFNHFAKDMGLPLDLDEAADVIMHGELQRVDYGMLNGRIFVNNSSLGVYPLAVLERERKRQQLGKWPATLRALGRALALDPTVHATLKFPSKQLEVASPLVFIGNNAYQLHRPGFTGRKSLVSGKLFVYVVRATRPASLVRLALMNFVGLHAHRGDYQRLTAGPVLLESAAHKVAVALDGEVLRMEFPLEYRVMPRSLPVLVPRKR